MTFTPDQYSMLAASYESAALDRCVPPVQRAAFADKAKWFRLLSRLAAKPTVSPVHLRAEEAAPEQPNAPATPVPMMSAARHLFAWQSFDNSRR